MGFNVGHFFSDAARSAGRGIGDAAHLVDKATGAIVKDIKKVPFVGPLFAAALDLAGTPFKFGSQILSGKNIAQSFVADLKSELKDVKAIAPYAQMVISLVPGIGPAVSGAIGAGVALAEGQPLSKALIAGVKGAIPGGPIAASIFSAAVEGAGAVASHKDVGTVLMNSAVAALPIPIEAQTGIDSAIKLASSIAKGEKPAQAVLDAADANIASLGIPPEAKKALSMGIALAHGTVTQTAIAKKAPGAVDKLYAIGQSVVAKDPVAAAAAKTAPSQRGFYIGLGLMQHQIGLTPLHAVRNSLSAADRRSFDIATSLHVGRVKTLPRPSLPPAHQVALALASGGTPPMTYPVALASGAGIGTMAFLALLEAPALAAWGLGAMVAGAILVLKRQ